MEKTKNSASPPHDEQNAIRLIHEINRIIHDQIHRECPEMQRSSRLLLMALSRQDNVTQLELVRATHLKAPTVSVSLQRMEKDGIVVRKADPSDLRATRVSLTKKGRELDRHITEKIRQQESRAQSCLTPTEQASLCALLLKIKNHMSGGTVSLESQEN